MAASISPQELCRLWESGKTLDLIDVRTPVEFREMHVAFARNIPLDRLDPKTVQSEKREDAELPLYVVCHSGSRGQKACERLLAAGVDNTRNVEGGTVACEAAGLPVVRGKKAISLERQVRIAAGFLVLIGAVLAITVHPYFAGLSAFVGAGLMFAGITDTCGMAMILARMPWNKVPGGSNSSGAVCRLGAVLLATAILAPAMTFAAEQNRNSLATSQHNVANQTAVPLVSVSAIKNR